MKLSYKLTRIPPGRLMDERSKTASCFAFTSTFHLLLPTSLIRPITTSPTSPEYLDRNGTTEINLLTLSTTPLIVETSTPFCSKVP